MTAWNVTNKIPVLDAKGTIIGTAGITRALNRDELPSGAVSEFEPVLAYMRDHYHRAITNQQLAAAAKMSLRAFERQFLASFHLTSQKYLRKLRLRIASRALIYANESLSEVALICGFADQSHFTREFRRHFGRTPRDYRKHYKTVTAVSGTKSAVPKQ
jgi:transcriptional regulator GlxA family with amidase domain